jgi:hypothetical protein
MLMAKLAEVEKENSIMKSQLTTISNIMKKDPIILERMKIYASSTNKAKASSLTAFGKTQKVATLFVALFSFAIFAGFGGSNSFLMGRGNGALSNEINIEGSKWTEMSHTTQRVMLAPISSEPEPSFARKFIADYFPPFLQQMAYSLLGNEDISELETNSTFEDNSSSFEFNNTNSREVYRSQVMAS